MEKLTQFWNWLDGKKSAIGGALMFVAFILDKVVGGIWGVEGEILSKFIATFEWAGGVLTGVGLTHKGIKTLNQ